MNETKRRKWTDEQLIEAVKTCKSRAEVFRKLGFNNLSGSHYRMFTILVDKLKLDISHFTGKGHGKTTGNRRQYLLEEILVKDSSYVNTNALKKRLLKEGKLTNKCAICGLKPEWNGNPLVLRLDHINGDPRDHRLKNLRIVCPNCDSQLPTFCSKKR